MEDKIILYTIGCPQCIVLEEKLNNAGIQYDIVNDKEKILALGITKVPALQVGTKIITSLAEANNWIKERSVI